MTAIKPGDEVRILKNRRRYESSIPADGFAGTVTKVGRKYATAEYVRDGITFKIEFDMETAYERGVNSSYGYRVLTAAQFEADRRRADALAALSRHHIEIKMGHERSFPTERLEALAEVVKNWED